MTRIFRATIVEDSMAAEQPETRTAHPYLTARREWDERYGHLITRERNWRIMAFICALAALLAIGGMIRLSTKSRIVPFVVAMDSLGRTVAAGPTAVRPIEKSAGPPARPPHEPRPDS